MIKTILRKNTLLAVAAIVLGFIGASYLFSFITRQAKVTEIKPPIKTMQIASQQPSVEKVVPPLQQKIVETQKTVSPQKGQIQIAVETATELPTKEIAQEPVKEPEITSQEKAVQKPPTLPNLVLSGIFFDKSGESFALINDKIAREGNYIEGAKLNKIYFDKVEMDKDGYKFYLKIL